MSNVNLDALLDGDIKLFKVLFVGDVILVIFLILTGDDTFADL